MCAIRLQQPERTSGPEQEQPHPLAALFPSALDIDGIPAPLGLVRGGPRRSRLAIRITRAAGIELLLPPQAGVADIHRALSNREGWIQAHVRAMRLLPAPPPASYTESSPHWYLGREYALHIIDASLAPPGARSTQIIPDPVGNQLRLRLVSPSPEAVRTVLQRWFRNEARRIIGARLSKLCMDISWMNHTPPWKLQTMRRRWGSCSGEGRLTLNTRLVHTPLECVDYVLLHELSHIREMNHSKKFYAVLAEICPDWARLRNKLEQKAYLYLAL